MPVRTGFKDINVEMIEYLIVIESIYNVETRNSPALLCYNANKLFGQHWSVESELDIKNQIKKQSSAEISCQCGETDSPVIKKRKKDNFQMEFVLSLQRAIRKMVGDFSLRSFEDIAERIVKGATIT